ncbi:hypothetical protein NDU88_003384 [Pleurodeles waltl]|uniref:Uncharacterized protein n=1 Tax=Pleurodeles waltl TaxID=8319 RepID=A0AAV7W1Z6_PLEWA|nr:hypothetical protein NDU88_003384 [Pleurodeles waltl]
MWANTSQSKHVKCDHMLAPYIGEKNEQSHSAVYLEDKLRPEQKRQADTRCLTTTSRLKLRDVALMRLRQAQMSDNPFLSHPLTIMTFKGTMITAAAGPYSITKNSSHFIEFLMLEDDEGEGSKGTQMQIWSNVTHEAAESCPSHGYGPLCDEEAEDEQGSQRHHARESARPLWVIQKAKRLIEEI